MSAMLDKMLDLAEASFRRHIGQKDTILTIWHVMHEDGTSEVIGTPWENDAQKYGILAALQATFTSTDVIAYCVAFEAWTMPEPMFPNEIKAITGDENVLPHPRVMPNRVESFIAIATDGTESILKSWFIRRDRRRRVTAIIPREVEGNTAFKGIKGDFVFLNPRRA